MALLYKSNGAYRIQHTLYSGEAKVIVCFVKLISNVKSCNPSVHWPEPI